MTALRKLIDRGQHWLEEASITFRASARPAHPVRRPTAVPDWEKLSREVAEQYPNTLAKLAE
jgi:hypothetical protein